MQNKVKMLLASLILVISWGFAVQLNALPANYKPKDDKEQLQAENKRIQQLFDVRRNTVSNIDFYASNYGLFAHDVARNRGGGIWPRGSLNQYIFGGGIWFGGKKRFNGEDSLRTYMSVTYDPNNGESWMTPGRVIDHHGNVQLLTDPNEVYLNRTYISTDFNKQTGEPYDKTDKYNWPIWDTEQDTSYKLKYDRYFGRFVNNPDDRNLNKYPKGPAFISEEDIFATYKDTDLNRYKIGAAQAKLVGYPLKVQYEQMIYSWGFGEYKDFIFIKYDIINLSTDTLREAWMAPVMDVDVARIPYTSEGADNDNVKYYKAPDWEEPKPGEIAKQDTLNLAYQWTLNTRGEDGKGFGYLGYDFLESPSVHKREGETTVIEDGVEVEKFWLWSKYHNVHKGDIIPGTNIVAEKDTIVGIEKYVYDKALEGFVRKDKRYYETHDQLGLVSFRNWNISEDKKTAYEQYNFLSAARDGSYIRDDDSKGAADKRFMMATGPFSMLPKDTVRVVVGIILALPSKFREANGTEEDVQNLKRRDMFAQKVYDNHFKAPTPPDNSRFLGYKSYNNAIEIYWDSTAEMSYDAEENGLAFMGYKLYRARDPKLDTFNVNVVAADNQYTKGRGPFAWKEVASWEMPTPFMKSGRRVDPKGSSRQAVIDEFDIAGIGYDYVKDPATKTEKLVMDTMALTIMRYPAGMSFNYETRRRETGDTTEFATNSILDFNMDPKIDNPWAKYFQQYWKDSYKNFQLNPMEPWQEKYKSEPFISQLVYGTLRFDDAFLPANPLYYREITIKARGFVKKVVTGEDGKKTTVIEPVFDITPEKMNDTTFVQSLVTHYKDKDNTIHIYLYSTLRGIEIDGKVEYYITKLEPLWEDNAESWKRVFQNEGWLRATKEKIYEAFEKGHINKIVFNDKDIIYDKARAEVIVPYMSQLTNGRKYYDFADDGNKNKVVETSENSAITERLLNNIEYYYKLEAYDEGDYLQPTESKSNDGSVGRSNNIRAYAKAGRPDLDNEFEITRIDQDKLGGIRNFKFFAIDNDRLNQKLAGKTLVVKFEPYSQVNKIAVPGSLESGDKQAKYKFVGLYRTKVTVSDQETGEKIFESFLRYDEGRGSSYMNQLSENGFSVILGDTVRNDVTGEIDEFGKPFNTDKINIRGSFTTGMFNVPNFEQSFNFTNGYENIFGFSFDYGFEQQGGVLRSESVENLTNPNVTTTLAVLKDRAVEFNYEKFISDWDYAGTQHTYIVDRTYQDGSNVFVQGPDKKLRKEQMSLSKQVNLGPADYEVTFKEGGTEEMTVTYMNGTQKDNPEQVTFTVPYLTYAVKNTYEVEMEYPNSKEKINYGFEYMPQELPATKNYGKVALSSFTGGDKTISMFDAVRTFPHPSNLGEDATSFMGKFNSFAIGYINTRNAKITRPSAFKDAVAVMKDKEFDENGPNVLGTQNRYYLSAVSGDKTIDFVNVLNINGAFFFLDYSQVGRFLGRAEVKYWNTPAPEERQYGEDFKAGDKILAKVRGGAFGLPVNGAEIHAKVKPVAEKYTEDHLAKVNVVPNPYYISHEAQKSAYDTKLYITRLPKVCDIDIYTINGDLVKSIKHAVTEPDRFNDGESASEYASYRYAMEPWDLYSSNNQRVQSQTFIALITTPEGAKQTVRFTVLVGSTRLVTE